MDPKFFYKPYFLEAQKGGEKAYGLLHKALAGTGKIGIAKVVISNREHLASVKPDGLFLVLELMHFASEILSPAELKTGPSGASFRQGIKMAQTLIESMSVVWEPDKYRDEYRNAVLEIIEQKAQNKQIADRPAAPVRATNVVDLVKVLQESLSRNQSLKTETQRLIPCERQPFDFHDGQTEAPRRSLDVRAAPSSSWPALARCRSSCLK